MATRLGPASIQVVLDLKAAEKQLSDFEKRIKTFGETTERKRDEEDDNQEKQKETGEKIKQVVIQVQQQAKAGRFGISVAKFAVVTAAVTAFASLLETGLAASGIGLREAFKGTMFEAVAKELEERILTKTSDLISNAISAIQALIPSVKDTADVVRSKFLLGENPTVGETSELFGVLYEVNEAQARLKRQSEKLLPESIARFFGELIQGGTKR